MKSESLNSAAKRLHALDVLRGLTILIMMFVNDVAGVRGAPAWMKHVSPSNADGMTLPDVVFPAFLFIAGMSLPFAMERRFSRGESQLVVLRHILVRTLSLLIIGVLMVNTENISANALLDPRLWQLLMYTGVCLTWIAPSRGSRRNNLLRRWAGGLLLLFLAAVYRGEGQSGLVYLQPQWWGILGLIGWAYLVAGILYLVLRANALGMAAAAVLLYCIYFADAVGFFNFLGGFNHWISIGSMLGSHAAITVCGALLGLSLLPSVDSHFSRIRTALFIAGVQACVAVLLHSLHHVHSMFYYNKIAATVPWCLLSSAYVSLVWAGIYWLLEVSQPKLKIGLLGTAGQNALFAFILGPVLYTLFELLPLLFAGFDPWGWLGSSFFIGLPRSLILAVSTIWLTGFLQRRGLATRL